MFRISDNHLRRRYSTTRTTTRKKNVVRLRHGNTRTHPCDSQDWWRVSTCARCGSHEGESRWKAFRNMAHHNLHFAQTVRLTTEPFSCACVYLHQCPVGFSAQSHKPRSHSHTHLCLAVRIWSDAAGPLETSSRFWHRHVRTRALPTPICRNSP